MVIVVSPLLKSVEDANFESEAGESVRSLKNAIDTNHIRGCEGNCSTM